MSRLHYLQHVPFEDPGIILPWANERGHTVTATKLFEEVALPLVDEFEFLVVMGGPMGVHDVDQYPWLNAEVDFIRQVVESGKPILGICLGAQLIAHALGADVKKNDQPEIGWWPVALTESGRKHGWLPDRLDVLHWHGDTFDIPASAEHHAVSEACTNQAFLYRGNVFGMQFHLEATEAGLRRLADHCRGDLVSAPFVASEEALFSDSAKFHAANQVMRSVLDQLFVD